MGECLNLSAFFLICRKRTLVVPAHRFIIRFHERIMLNVYQNACLDVILIKY